MPSQLDTRTAPSAFAPRKPRDVRLDVFRGIGMFIIFIAHVPGNAWSLYIPARFGFSDATEIFVFCSGMASAIAFGRLFEERGFMLGSARVAYRCWQVYWAHVCMFVLIAAMLVAVDDWLGTGNAYIGGLNLIPFFEGDTTTNLLGFLTLTYVPNYFDILPMYLVILTLIPVVMALSRVHPFAVFALLGCLWIMANANMLNLPAEPWSDRPWFFNPFGWQLVFFTGFAFIRGWIPAPPIDRRLMIAAAAFVAISVPLYHWPLASQFAILRDWNAALQPYMNKTNFGILRYVHFLSLAYLAYALAGEAGARLSGPLVDICRKVGQQALGVFLAGMTLSQLAGVTLNLMGRNVLTYALVNITGCALLVGVAYTVAWYKGVPWRARKSPQTAPPAAPAADTTRTQAAAGPFARPAE